MKKSILSAPYIMWIIILVGIFIEVYFLPRVFMFEPNTLAFVFFFFTFVYWMYFFIKAITINPEAPRRPEHITELVVTGVYQLVRHPMYSADIILAWGVFVAYPLISVFFGVLWLTVVMVVWSYIEEVALIRKFGDAYISYQKKTPMFIPKKRK